MRRLNSEAAAKKKRMEEEEIESISSSDEKGDNKENEIEESEDDTETPQEKRLRLAKEYLTNIENEEETGEGDGKGGQDVTAKLNEEVLEKSGKLQRIISHKYHKPSPIQIVYRRRGHRQSPTAAIISPDSQFVFSASKDGSIIKWTVNGLQKVRVLTSFKTLRSTAPPKDRHSNQILALAISSDGKYLASGGLDLVIIIWDPTNLEHLHTFSGHKGGVTGLAFRQNTHQLFSSSFDRFVMIWDLDLMTCVDTLFGHQEAVTDVDSFVNERAISSGGRDSTAHLWKIVEESQLVFRTEGAALDRIRYINEEHFMTGSDEGEISIWHIAKKRPVLTFKHTPPHTPADPSPNPAPTHSGADVEESSPPDIVPTASTSILTMIPTPLNDTGAVVAADATTGSPYWATSLNSSSKLGAGVLTSAHRSPNPHWITALAAIPNSDVIATGSSDSFIRLWKCDPKYKGVSLLFDIHVPGFINSLAFSNDGRYLVAAVGKEHRLGRWKVLESPNCVVLVDLIPAVP